MSAETFLGGKVVLCCGDSIHFLRDQPDNRYDSIVTDPPYALISISKRFANSPRSEAAMPTSPPHARMSRGFMGQRWDNGEAAHSVAFWIECLRVLKPGGHVLAFAGTRTYHRLACAVEDAGFEIRDMVQWLYGSGFPKSHDVSKGIDKAAGAEREVIGSHVAPGFAKLNVEHGAQGRTHLTFDKTSDTPATVAASEWQGWGTALKPANEPIVLARKPLSEGTVAANVLRWGTGAINIDGCRVQGETWASSGSSSGGETVVAFGDGLNNSGRSASHQQGRWPANVITDGSEEVVAMFPAQAGALAPVKGTEPSVPAKGDVAYGFRKRVAAMHHGDSGSAARFFYHAKANKADRAGSKHPTIKPIALIRYLIRLITPPGGLVLDPFAGTGTTAEAAFREGMSCALVEREAEYQADIRRRMALLEPAPDLFTAEPTPVLIPAHGMGTTILRSDPPPRWPRASYAARGRRVFPGPVR